MTNEEKQVIVDRVENIIANGQGGNAFTHEWSGGIRRFGNLLWEDTKNALAAADGLADLAPWNNFIGTPELIKEAGRLEALGYDVTFHGYLVGNGRDDARFTLEGLQAYSEDIRALAFASARGADLGADEFGIQGDSVIWWWD
jgi:hypothetical protein